MIKVIPFIYNNDADELLANTYLLIDDASNCVVVDPSKNNDNIKNYIIKNNLDIKAVLLTHAHFDHFKGAEILTNQFKIPLFVDAEDEFMLRDIDYNCSSYMETPVIFSGKTEFLPRNGVLKLLNDEIKVIKTPYHTKGSVCFYLEKEKILISGDFLFKSGIGRDDLPNNASKMLNLSLNNVFALPDDVKVYPGHGPSTQIGIERNLFQFVK